MPPELDSGLTRVCCCAGMQWRKAAEVFEKMHGQGCIPDVVTYTALISAYEKGGQWRRALGAFDQNHQNIKVAVMYRLRWGAVANVGNGSDNRS